VYLFYSAFKRIFPKTFSSANTCICLQQKNFYILTLLELIAVKSSFLRIFTWILLKLRASPTILAFLATQNTRFSILLTIFSIKILTNSLFYLNIIFEYFF